MKTLAVAFSLLTTACALFADPLEDGSVSSTNASYDGNALILTGKVILDHGLGKMNAEKATLQRQESGKDFPFSLIHLQKEVLLSLKNSAEIRCDSADLDFNSLKGHLLSSGKGKVIYADTLKKKNKESAFFRIMSETVELGLSKKEQGKDKVDYDVETILATNDVIIDYAYAFTLRADHALFRKQIAPKGSVQKEFQGIVTAYPKDAYSQCRLTHQSDIIDADSIDLDMIQSKVSMHRPKGVLMTHLLPHLQNGEIQFDCDHLTWDHGKNILTLKGHVHVNETTLGKVTTDDELQIVQSLNDDKRLLKHIRSKGYTNLEYLDPESKEMHSLSTYGSLKIDREKLSAFIDSPVTNGVVASHHQIHYEEPKVSVYSDKAAIEYSIVENTLQPVSLSLKGGVRLYSKDPTQPARCALSDRMNYCPATRTLILSADPGKRVLFWDEGQGLKVSAQEVHITPDPVTGKENIQGVGSVKLAFNLEENQLLKTLFPFLKLPNDE